jgi:serine/threonine-protein kinase
MLSEGQVIGGKYRITRQLARGGMGEVCLAVHEGPGGFARQVVIKTLLPELSQREDLVQMFLGEAQLAAQLTHPNIVHVYDFGQEGPSYFFGLEYLQGATLSELLRRNRKTGRKVSSTFVCAIGSQVCAGLAYAFSKVGPDGEPLRVVHRDVSPQNILVCEEGVAKLLDFGIAKAKIGQAANSGDDVKGKPSYLSPEQARGLPADSRSDIFSLGIVLWEALAGHKLFVGNGALELADQVCCAPIPPLSEVMPELPNDLSLAIARALERDPERRFQSAAEMGRVLESLFQSLGGQSMQEELLFELHGESPLGASTIAAPQSLRESPNAPLTQWMSDQAYSLGTDSPPGAEAPLELDLARASSTREPRGEPAYAAAPRMAAQPEPRAVSHVSPAPRAVARPVARAVRAAAPGAAIPKAPGGRAWIVGVGIAALLLAGAAAALLVPRGGANRAAEPDAKAGAQDPGWLEELKTVDASISTVPNGAAIWIDGVDSGKTTPATLKLESGREHTIALRHPDFLEVSTTSFAEPKKPIKIDEVLTPGAHVAIETEPAGAEIEIDGKPAFKTPGRSAPLPNGKHVLWARLAGHIPEKRELDLAGAQPVHFALQLAAGTEVAVTSTPDGAEILVDGAETGSRTPGLAVVTAGKPHNISVRKDGFLPQTKKLGVVKAGQQLTAEFTLQSAEQTELKARIARLAKELATWERRLEDLSKRQSGMVVNRTASQELALERQTSEAEERVEDLSAELNDAREKLAELEGAR